MPVTRSPKNPGRISLGALLVVLVVVALSACGGSTSSSDSGGSSAEASGGGGSKCSGTPVKIVTITNLSNPLGAPSPVEPASVTAAAAAVTKSCELGRPVQVIHCDEKFSPNGASACARKAVSEKAVAVVTYSGFGDNIVPIVAKAGIPSVGNNAASSSENTSSFSFPFQSPVPQTMGNITALASLGAKHIAFPAIDIPAVNFFVNLAGLQAKQLGVKFTPIRMSPTATDYTPYAGQILSVHADAVVPLAASAGTAALAKALVAQGADLKGKIKYMQDLSQMTPKFAQQLGSNVDGFLATATAWSPTDSSTPAIARYISELKAAGQPSGPLDVSTLGVMGWAAVHVIADALKGRPVSTKELVARLNTHRSVDTTKYAMPPIDFSKPAFPKAPLNKMRLFSDKVSVWEFDAEGTPQPLSEGWLHDLKPMNIKPLA